jgi:hypothetical protein
MENKFPKSLIVVLWFIAAGLFLNAALPFIVTPAVAQYGVQKVAICDVNGELCADVWTYNDWGKTYKGHRTGQ